MKKTQWEEQSSQILEEVREHENLVLDKIHELSDTAQTEETNAATMAKKAEKAEVEEREKAKRDQKRKILAAEVATLVKTIAGLKDIDNQG